MSNANPAVESVVLTDDQRARADELSALYESGEYYTKEQADALHAAGEEVDKPILDVYLLSDLEAKYVPRSVEYALVLVLDP